MKLMLMGFQTAAVEEVVRRLRQFTVAYDEGHDFSALSLTAPTGAGKTIIATAAIEQLFFGNDDAAADPQASVLWVTDNPSLNEQTKRKMLVASSELKAGHLTTVDTAFDSRVFAPGRVYFLNIQKLSRTATTTQSGTDGRTHSLWETIANSYREFGSHMYVIIDEAHRGTGVTDPSRTTIIRRLVSDPEGLIPPAPVVWGISATPERFDQAMAEAQEPDRNRRQVRVDPAEVRASGLLKDFLDIRHVDDAAAMTLTRLAAADLREATDRWEAYSREEGEQQVLPVLVVQVPAAVSDDTLVEIVDALREEWDVLEGAAIAHTFEDHTAKNLPSGQQVRYISPENIQEDRTARAVLFKEALTTGWDCPRAETMLSFRKAEDYTYIAQLIGRMVRTPLARRVPGDERLNSVSLFLPNFDEEAVEAVVSRLRADPTAPPVEALRNAAVCTLDPGLDAVTEVVATLPSYVVPGRTHASQVSRLHQLAMLLAGDDIVPGALRLADEHLIATIERERANLRASGELAQLIDGIKRVAVGRMRVDLADGAARVDEERAPLASKDIDAEFRAANRGLRDRLATTYWAWLMRRGDTEAPNDSDECKILVAALASSVPLVQAVEQAAADLVRTWLSDHGIAISNLTAAERARYASVRAQAAESEEVGLALPAIVMAAVEPPVQWWPSHIYGIQGEGFPARLNAWEQAVLEKEMNRATFRGWYRNPTGGDRSLRVPYRDGDWDKAFYPDFVVVHETATGLRPSLLDPHDYGRADALPKWRGLAKYAEKHGDLFQRIDAVIMTVDQRLVRLDLLDPEIRRRVLLLEGHPELVALFEEHGSAYI